MTTDISNYMSPRYYNVDQGVEGIIIENQEQILIYMKYIVSKKTMNIQYISLNLFNNEY